MKAEAESLFRARLIVRGMPNPGDVARHAQELRWAAALVAVEDFSKGWQARAVGMTDAEWRKVRRGIDPVSTFGRLLKVIDGMGQPGFDETAFDGVFHIPRSEGYVT